MRKMIVILSLFCFSTVSFAQSAVMPKPKMAPKVAPKVVAPKPVIAPKVAAPKTTPKAIVAPKIVVAPKVITKAEPKAKTESKMSTAEIIDLVFKILLGLVSLVFIILRSLGHMAWTKNERWKKVQLFMDLAFAAVEGIVKNTDNKIDDKLLEFFKRINEMLKEEGAKELSEAEKKAAAAYAANKALADKK